MSFMNFFNDDYSTEPSQQESPILTILIGPPYSGKSTFIRNNLNDGVVISSDKFIHEKAKALNKSYEDVFSDTIEEANKKSQQEFFKALKSGKNVIIDKTNMTRKGRKYWIKKSKEYGYKINAIVFPELSEPEYNRRKKIRNEQIISNEVYQRFKDSYQKPTEEEGFDDIKFI